jgi:hypothetical protein
MIGAVVNDRSARSGWRGRALARGFALALVVLGAGLTRSADAQATNLTITSPAGGDYLNTRAPTFAGSTTDVFNEELEIFDPITVNIYEGASVTGQPVQTTPPTPRFKGPNWAVAAAENLPRPGVYTAQAVQGMEKSEPVSFTLDTMPPVVTLEAPANGSSTTSELQLFAGKAGTDPGDVPEVTIKLFAGSTAAGPPLEVLIVSASSGSWSVYGALGPGIYTAQATQEDAAGNTGASLPVTFTIAPPAPHPNVPPSPSFSWFPPAPVVGQAVTLVSGSTDAASPITSFAWDVAGNGSFDAAGPMLTTSFTTAGNHAVRLRVTDARGISSVATETIPVGLPPLRTMQPFPIVRIAGVQTGSGVRLSVVSVQAPIGSRVTVTCRGRGCRTKPQSRIASASKHTRHANSALLAFASFEREFRAGVTLEVRVGAAGEIGKYTLFAIHRHSLPTRVDSCLAALDPQPIACTP